MCTPCDRHLYEPNTSTDDSDSEPRPGEVVFTLSSTYTSGAAGDPEGLEVALDDGSGTRQEGTTDAEGTVVFEVDWALGPVELTFGHPWVSLSLVGITEDDGPISGSLTDWDAEETRADLSGSIGPRTDRAQPRLGSLDDNVNGTWISGDSYRLEVVAGQPVRVVGYGFTADVGNPVPLSEAGIGVEGGSAKQSGWAPESALRRRRALRTRSRCSGAGPRPPGAVRSERTWRCRRGGHPSWMTGTRNEMFARLASGPRPRAGGDRPVGT